MSYFDNPAVTSARESATKAASVAGRAEAEGMTLPDLLKDTLMKKFASPDNPLIQNREQALTRYLNEGTRAPLRVTAQSAGGEAPVVFNPLEQANLIQGYRSAPTAALASANTMLGMQRGGISDVIGEAGRAYGGYTKGLQAEAENKRQGYKDVLDEMAARADEAYKNASLSQKKTKEEEKNDDAAKSILSSLTDIQNARAKLAAGGSGWLSQINPLGIRTKIGGPLGLSKQASQLKTALTQANTRLFETAGKAFTGPERELLQGIILNPEDRADIIIDRLDEAERKLKDRLMQLTGEFDINSEGGGGEGPIWD